MCICKGGMIMSEMTGIVFTLVGYIRTSKRFLEFLWLELSQDIPPRPIVVVFIGKEDWIKVQETFYLIGVTYNFCKLFNSSDFETNKRRWMKINHLSLPALAFDLIPTIFSLFSYLISSSYVYFFLCVILLFKTSCQDENVRPPTFVIWKIRWDH